MGQRVVEVKKLIAYTRKRERPAPLPPGVNGTNCHSCNQIRSYNFRMYNSGYINLLL
jgi:hypothetical protein